ncbi:unnamed protein product [Effrenium voratum]|nr:unnamed protein product [Effrenium voratum]
MGNQQARQRVLASRGGSGTALPMNGSPIFTAAVAAPDPAASVVVESEQDDRIPVVFTWTHGGQNVFLAASFNQWKDQIPMVRSGQEFSVVQELPRGVHQYKFIVDDQWRFAPDQPRMQDSQGNMNNVLDISTYQRFQVSQVEDKDVSKFGQMISDPNDYTLDAPVVPMVLSKSTFAAIPTRLAPGQLMNIPTHCLCDHVYFREREDALVARVAQKTRKTRNGRPEGPKESQT